MRREPPRSLRDFDYFAEAPAQALTDEQPDDVELPPGAPVVRRALHHPPRVLRVSLAVLATIACLFWLWRERGWIAYALSAPSTPAALGDVTDMLPKDIPANRYVSIEGITEHRGLTQKVIFGLSLGRDELWLFRLVGSQGVYIVTPPDASRFAPGTLVQVSGRAIEPSTDSTASAFLAAYRQRYSPRLHGEERVVFVDVAPGPHRTRYIVALLLCVGVVLVNTVRLASMLRRQLRAHA